MKNVTYADLGPQDYDMLTEGANAAQLFRLMQLSIEYAIAVQDEATAQRNAFEQKALQLAADKVRLKKRIEELEKELEALRKKLKSQEGIYRCPYCVKTYGVNRGLAAHLEREHAPAGAPAALPVDELVSKLGTIVREDGKDTRDKLDRVLSWNPKDHVITDTIMGHADGRFFLLRGLLEEIKGLLSGRPTEPVPIPSMPKPPIEEPAVVAAAPPPPDTSADALLRGRKHRWFPNEIPSLLARYPRPADGALNDMMTASTGKVRVVNTEEALARIRNLARKGPLTVQDVEAATEAIFRADYRGQPEPSSPGVGPASSSSSSSAAAAAGAAGPWGEDLSAGGRGTGATVDSEPDSEADAMGIKPRRAAPATAMAQAGPGFPHRGPGASSAHAVPLSTGGVYGAAGPSGFGY